MTGWGKALLFFSTVILLAALSTGRNVIYLVCSLLVSFMFVSSLMATISLYRLRLARIVPQHIFSRKPFLVETVVTNEKEFFPSFSLVVSNLLDGKELQGRYILKLPAKSSVSVAHKYLIEKRGRYTFHGIQVATTYPLDLFLKGYLVTDPEPILVYPRIVKLNPNFLNAMVSEIENQVNRAGLGAELYGFKKYQSGDDSRFINWRLSAKTRDLLVTKYCQEESLKLCVVFDNWMNCRPAKLGGLGVLAREKGRGEFSQRRRGRQDEEKRKADAIEKFESAVTFVASLCSFFVEAGFKVKLVTRSEVIPYGEGNKQLYEILKHLALIQPAEEQKSAVDIYSREHPESGIGLLVYCEDRPAVVGNFSRVFDAARMEGI